MTTKQSKAERAVLAKAEKLLRENARSIYGSCEGNREPWACRDYPSMGCPNCDAHRSYDEHMDVAARLAKLRRK